MTRGLRSLTRLVIVSLVAAVALHASETELRLVEAAKRGDAGAVASFLQSGLDANAAAPDGATALLWAAHLDNRGMAEKLLSSGANANAANRYGVTPLMLACTNGSTPLVELLLKAGADPNAATPTGETILMTAARTGRPEVVRALLAQGAKPNARESQREQTAVMWAAAEGHVETVSTLIDAGAEIGARSKGGFSAFLFAVRQGHVDVARLLLKAGADVDQRLDASANRRNQGRTDPNGPTALGIAITNAHYELAAVLLDAGADPNTTWRGYGPLHAITWVRKPGAGSNNPVPMGSGTMDSLQLVRKLVEQGADVNARMTARSGAARTVLNMRGATPFLLAARTADAELMRLLAELGADPLLANEDNTTPLMVAAGIGVQAPGEDPGTESEVSEAVKVALELGNDVNAVDKRGDTAMHGAAYKHVPAVVPLLVKNGADINTWNRKNKLGWTPLRIATGVHRGMNFRSSRQTAEALRQVMIAAGVSTVVEPETNISGATQ